MTHCLYEVPATVSGRFRTIVAGLAAFALFATMPAEASDEAAKLHRIADAHASVILSVYPEWATQLGVSEDVAGAGFPGRLSELGPDANANIQTMLTGFLDELDDIDPAELEGQDRITYAVMKHAYSLAERHNRFGVGQASLLSAGTPYVVNQLFGPQIDLPRLLIAQQPLNTKRDVEAWQSRLADVDRVLDELATLTEADAERAVTPPYFVLEAIVNSTKTFTAAEPEAHPIASAFESRLEGVADAGEAYRKRELEKAIAILEKQLYPAYRNFAARMEALIPAAGRDAGLWRIEDGAALYQLALDAWGADGMTPDEIHRIGLDDVDRIHREMDAILRAAGYRNGAVGERMRALASDPRHLIANTDAAKAELVESLQAHVDAVLKIAPQWFTGIPSHPIEVRRIPAHEEAAAPGGYYTPPPLDGSRPGIFWINLKDSADVPVYTLKSLVYHESVPGHHFQAAKALSIQGLPLLQNMLWFGDYGEGWALYAEELAKEMGLYEGDPLGDLGRLRMELYRAARLVVDTGLHHKRWSRERAIEYMVDVTGESEASITREIERYAVWPGQAASYKLGMIRFQRLREEAELRLGDAFDIREFHDVVLRDGAVPMSVLTRIVHEWLDGKQAEFAVISL